MHAGKYRRGKLFTLKRETNGIMQSWKWIEHGATVVSVQRGKYLTALPHKLHFLRGRCRHAHLDKYRDVAFHEIVERGPRVAEDEVAGEVRVRSRASAALLDLSRELVHVVRLHGDDRPEVPAQALVQHVLRVEIHRVTPRQIDRFDVAKELREALEPLVQAPLHLFSADQERFLQYTLGSRGQGRVGPADGAGLLAPREGIVCQLFYVADHEAHAGEVTRTYPAPLGADDERFSSNPPGLLGLQVLPAAVQDPDGTRS